jgi:hypothetical protein
MIRTRGWVLLGALLSVVTTLPSAADVTFNELDNGLEIQIGDQPFATYIHTDTKTYNERKLTRPYFAHVYGPGGIQVTRNFPPIPDKDLTDHETYHPGIWMAFGDISGADSWRMKARVRHDGYVRAPHGGKDRGNFTVRNVYEDAEGSTVCIEECRYTVVVRQSGYFLLMESTFSNPDADFVIGDQEEMGMGVRAATELTVKKGNGRTINSYGRLNEEDAWGKKGDWAAILGEKDGKQVGIVAMPNPDNFRRCWFHIRDYGLIISNPFGINAYTGGEKNAIPVKQGESFDLKYGIAIAVGNAAPDPAALYEEYVRMVSPSVVGALHGQ